MKPKSRSRKQFEEWISQAPYEREVTRFSNDETKHAWPGQYKDHMVQIAWEAWEQGRDSVEGLE